MLNIFDTLLFEGKYKNVFRSVRSTMPYSKLALPQRI